MLTKEQEKFLLTIPKDKIAIIKPWNPKIHKAAQKIIARIKAVDPKLEVLYIGASALEIAGINDIDIIIACPYENFSRHLPKLNSIFGKASGITKESIYWENGLLFDGYSVEVCMTDPNSMVFRENLKIFNILKNNKKLRAKYQKLKENANGLSYQEYQKRKYRFYNNVLKHYRNKNGK